MRRPMGSRILFTDRKTLGWTGYSLLLRAFYVWFELLVCASPLFFKKEWGWPPLILTQAQGHVKIDEKYCLKHTQKG